MSSKVNQLDNYVKGSKTSNGGLHFVGTPDTEELVINVRNQVQALLDIAHMNTEYSSRKNVTMEIIGDYKEFASGESISTLNESVRGKHVYLFSDPNGDYQEEISDEETKKLFDQMSGDSEKEIIKKILSSIKVSSLNDKVMHDLLLLSAIETHGAKTTNIVQSSMAYARQDKMTPKKRQPASLRHIGEMISSITGSNGYCITADMHNESAAVGVFSKTNFINLYTGWFVDECIKLIGKKDMLLSGADQGGDNKIKAIAKELMLEHMVVIKSRDYSKENSVEKTDIYGDIEGRDVLIHDDMLDTGGTMCKLLEEMLEKKPKFINIAVTHGMFNGKALERLEETIKKSNGVIQNVYMTNSINKKGLPDFIKQVDLSNILANNILRIYKGLGLERNDNKDYTESDDKG
ncbi:MAG: ribose-phosphate diphosphokinase [Candidatus Gracilibacteria bacterium]